MLLQATKSVRGRLTLTGNRDEPKLVAASHREPAIDQRSATR